MTATPESIPSELTLEIENDLSPERFLAAARAFFGYVTEISEALSPSGAAPKWIVKIDGGSALLGVTPAPSSEPTVVQAIYSKAENGIRLMAHGDMDQAALPEGALRHLRTLSELTEGKSGIATEMRLWVRRKPTDVSAKIADVIREEWRTDYKDFGTVEGRLESIQDRDGKLILQIRDAFFRQTIRCYFPEDMLDEAFHDFRKRVEISGSVHYRKNGAPISIEVSHIERLPDDDELPTANDVRGLLKNSI